MKYPRARCNEIHWLSTALPIVNARSIVAFSGTEPNEFLSSCCSVIGIDPVTISSFHAGNLKIIAKLDVSDS